MPRIVPTSNLSMAAAVALLVDDGADNVEGGARFIGDALA